MGYYVSNMFGIKTGSIFSEGSVDREHVRMHIADLVVSMRGTENSPHIGDADGDPDHCMSKVLEARKGDYIVLAGVFNYWKYKESSEFARRLSEIFGTEVMHMCWDEERDEVQCQVWLDGKPLFEANENPIGRILRRTI